MIGESERYRDEVALKYRIYNGLFLDLPFHQVRRAGIMLPLFADRARAQLAAGRSPADVVEGFFAEQMPELDDAGRTSMLFRFLQLVERQIVLFDALEDAAFTRLNDLEGPGTLHDLLGRIERDGDPAELRAILDEYRVRIVLTAHPTQFYPSTILGIIADLGDALAANETARVHQLLLQLGMTRARNRSRPTPLDEARSLMWFLERVFYHTVPDIQRRLEESVARSSGHDATVVDAASGPGARAFRPTNPRAEPLPPIVELGFWPGGDRDGNPFVTAETTRDVADMLRRSILSLYRREVEALARRITFDGVREDVAAIDARLAATLTGACEEPLVEPYAHPRELVADLDALRADLDARFLGVGRNRVDDLARRVALFGFHFATLDLRQDSRVHAAALADAVPGYVADGTPEARIAAVVAALDGDVASIASRLSTSDDALRRDAVDAFRVARDVRAAAGERALHRAIISNTRSAADVLDVLLLSRAAGFTETDGLDIVPLFETVEDLTAAPATVERLWSIPAYRRHLAQRGDRQTIMLGFSDGTKDGGYLAANWLIYRARVELTRVARKAGVELVFFEGRGGPPARGGGKTHEFYRALNEEASHRQIHLTIQGQTISSSFGTVPAARFNLEQLVTAGLETILSEDDAGTRGAAIAGRPAVPQTRPTDAHLALLEELSGRSLREYRALKERDDFIPYLVEVTPLTAYGEANNASRPTSRAPSGPLTLGALRAIPFVGAWSQMKQNVPGYYGFGSAVQELIDAGRIDELQATYRENRFFRALVDNSMQSLSKATFDVTRHLADDPRFGGIWRTLEAEYRRTRDALLAVAGATDLLPDSPGTRTSIAIRESIILPVIAIQQYALSQLRTLKDDDRRDIARRIVVKSMAAIINAGRNSV